MPHFEHVRVRENGGGDAGLNDVLWTYACDKPFKQYGGTVVKLCARLKTEYGKARYIDIYGEDAWNAANGTILQFGMDPNANLIVPQPLPLRYRGPVYLLVSKQTFSSAMQCALAAKDYGLATIIGEQTGEPVNSSGEIYGFTAPATKLKLYLTTKYFTAPEPHPDGEGVVPDIDVEATAEDRAAGRDPVLERALALASGKDSSG